MAVCCIPLSLFFGWLVQAPGMGSGRGCGCLTDVAGAFWPSCWSSPRGPAQRRRTRQRHRTRGGAPRGSDVDAFRELIRLHDRLPRQHPAPAVARRSGRAPRRVRRAATTTSSGSTPSPTPSSQWPPTKQLNTPPECPAQAPNQPGLWVLQQVAFGVVEAARRTALPPRSGRRPRSWPRARSCGQVGLVEGARVVHDVEGEPELGRSWRMYSSSRALPASATIAWWKRMLAVPTSASGPPRRPAPRRPPPAAAPPPGSPPGPAHRRALDEPAHR